MVSTLVWFLVMVVGGTRCREIRRDMLFTVTIPSVCNISGPAMIKEQIAKDITPPTDRYKVKYTNL